MPGVSPHHPLSSPPAPPPAGGRRGGRRWGAVLLAAWGLLCLAPGGVLALQTGGSPTQQILEDLQGGGADEGAGAAGEGSGDGEGQAGGEEAGAEEPVEPLLPTEAVLEPSRWPDLLEDVIDKVTGAVPSLLAALVVLLVFYGIHRAVASLLRRLMGRGQMDPAAQEISLRLSRYLILGFGLVAAASQLGIRVTSILAGFGIIGLAVGFAAQDSLANLLAGLTILWDRPFRIGDNVTVAGTFGRVQEIGLRTTRIRTVEQLDAILPNKDVINQKILNHTLNPRLRLGIPLGIAYGEDTRVARKVLLAAVSGSDLILEQPAPEVVVTALADSAVSLELRVWLKNAHSERRAFFTLLEAAKIALDEAGIEIPFPQRTLHFPDLADDRPVPVAGPGEAGDREEDRGEGAGGEPEARGAGEGQGAAPGAAEPREEPASQAAAGGAERPVGDEPRRGRGLGEAQRFLRERLEKVRGRPAHQPGKGSGSGPKAGGARRAADRAGVVGAGVVGDGVDGDGVDGDGVDGGGADGRGAGGGGAAGRDASGKGASGKGAVGKGAGGEGGSASAGAAPPRDSVSPRSGSGDDEPFD